MFQTSRGHTVQFCHPGLSPHSALMYHFTKIWSRRLRWKPGGEELPHAWGQGREEVPYIQGERNPSKTAGVVRGHQGADRLKPRSQKTSQSDHRTTALSGSVKLSHAVRGHPRRTGSLWRGLRERGPLEKGMETTSVFLPWEPHEQYEKAKW